jgi:hypothetical protein
MSEPTADPLAIVLVSLMKGVVEREANPTTWTALVELQPRARDHFAIVGLELLVNEADGLAYLRQREQDDSTSPVPRLVPRRPLSYPVSLLLALLRGKLAELDATSGETRLVLGRATSSQRSRTKSSRGRSRLASSGKSTARSRVRSRP